MTTRERTDCHRPSEIVPADYAELFCFARPTTCDGFPVPGYNMDAVRAKADVMWSGHRFSGTCDSCSASFVDGSLYLHTPTGDHVVLGHVCAAKMGMAFDESAARLMKKGRKAARKIVVAKALRRSVLREFVQGTCSRLLRDLRVDHHIVQNIRSRIILNASRRQVHTLISEAQAQLVRKIAGEIRERADRPEETNVAAPIADGRQTVEGVIVSAKTHEGQYGTCLKLTVKVTTEDGIWLCWGTCPSSMMGWDLGQNGLRGCSIRFDAKLQVGREEHFAFFKRPTKAALVGLGADQKVYLAKIKAELAEDRAGEGQQNVTEWEKGRIAYIAKLEALPGAR